MAPTDNGPISIWPYFYQGGICKGRKFMPHLILIYRKHELQKSKNVRDSGKI